MVTAGDANGWCQELADVISPSCPDHTNFPSTSGCEIVRDATTAGCQVVHTDIRVCSTFWWPVVGGHRHDRSNELA